MVAMNNYSLFLRETDVRRGVGVCLYLHDNLVGALVRLSPESSFADTKYLFIDVKPDQETILLAVIYKTPNASYGNDLETGIFMYTPNYKNIILMGDLNTNLNETNR